LPYNVATNCVLTAPLCHVDIVRLLCSELSLILSSVLLFACSVFFNKLNNNNNNNNNIIAICFNRSPRTLFPASELDFLVVFIIILFNVAWLERIQR